MRVLPPGLPTIQRQTRQWASKSTGSLNTPSQNGNIDTIPGEAYVSFSEDNIPFNFILCKETVL
jgi:hypothetical protein